MERYEVKPSMLKLGKCYMTFHKDGDGVKKIPETPMWNTDEYHTRLTRPNKNRNRLD